MIQRRFLVILPALLLMACSPASPAASTPAGESQPAGESAPAESAPAESAPEASTGGGGGGLATIDLTITGGDFDGSYQATITEGGCASGTQGENTFTVASSAVDPDTDFDGPQLTIYDATDAADGTDSQFSAAFVFNNYANTIEVNPYLTATQGSDFGSGTATLEDRGTQATITIEGTTSDGATVSATIECLQVTSF